MSTKDLLETITAAARERAKLSAEAAVVQLEASGILTGVSAADVEPVVQSLVRHRWFGLASRLGALAVAVFPEHRGLRRRYAQALIETGRLAEARAQFEQLLALPRLPGSERYECQGFIGRSLKQQFVNAERAGGSANPAVLRHAIQSYYTAYVDDPVANTWHGINAVALLKLAGRRGLAEAAFADADAIARDIIGALQVADAPTVWDQATWAEACVALGEWDAANTHLQKYLWDKGVNAFTLGSTLRQLEEIWEIRGPQDPGAPLVTLLRARLLEIEDGRVQLQASDVKATLADHSGRYEKVFGSDHFTTLRNYRKGLERCGAVARIGLDIDRGEGTGFLLRGLDLDPRIDGLVLVTNAHVIDKYGTSGGIPPENVVVTFQALDGVDAEDVFRVSEVLFCSPREVLDVTVARLEAPPALATPYPIAPQLPKNGARVIAIGHPGGGTLSFSLNDNELLDREEAPGWKVHYRTPTEGGSSGSPVFSREWNLIAVHHYGGDAVPQLNGKPGTYEANQGTSIQALRSAVTAALV
jgi:tetratricopeptide (TPR) repeat protein